MSKLVGIVMATSPYKGKDCFLPTKTTSCEEVKGNKGKSQSRKKIEQIGHDSNYSLAS